jgi:hypothetical protein
MEGRITGTSGVPELNMYERFDLAPQSSYSLLRDD